MMTASFDFAALSWVDYIVGTEVHQMWFLKKKTISVRFNFLKIFVFLKLSMDDTIVK